MGLTYQSSGGLLLREFIDTPLSADYVVALAGNPNTGKSTVFNALTGLRQHTGNWPGKTVVQARGNFTYSGRDFILVDLPGTYSLLANSPEEEIARDFICFGQPDAVVAVVDATCLERNLNLVLQIMEISPKTILCLNLIDEAQRKQITIDHRQLAAKLGIPVVPTAAREGKGLQELKETILQIATGELVPQPMVLRYPDWIEEGITRIIPHLEHIPPGLNKRWLALRLIDGDFSILESIAKYMEKRPPREAV
ncbi:MAG: FeoB small GTPase domain-containing protein [Limnochordia bacterium]